MFTSVARMPQSRFYSKVRFKKTRSSTFLKRCLCVVVIFFIILLFLRILEKQGQQINCIDTLGGSVISDVWVCMHAWDRMDLLRRAMLSVASQEQVSEGTKKINIKLVVFVDRCGAQLDVESLHSCDQLDWCTVLSTQNPNICPSLGSAAAKWTLLSHVGQRIRPSDYFTFLDGDDEYVTDHTLLDIYTIHLQPKRPFFAWGRQTGSFSEQCRDISEVDRLAVLAGEKQIREVQWSFCHPRIFRGKLISMLRESDFKHQDGTWLQKATDRPLIYAALELGGFDGSVFMGDEAHVKYSITHQNGLARFSKDIVSTDKSYTVHGLRRFSRLATEIHVVVAVYDRQNTETFLSHLSHSNLPEDTILIVHVANNLPSRQPSLEDLATMISSSNCIIKVTNMGKNYGGMARFILTRKIARVTLLDFVIFMDDDQYCFRNTVIRLWQQRKHRTMVSWFGKSWHDSSKTYWTPTFGWSEIKSGSNIPQNWHYAGTGMSVVDALIFSDERVFQIPKQYAFIEDVWLSYVLKANGWELRRAFVLFSWDSVLSTSGQYNSLKQKKDDFFMILNQCEFPLISKTEYAQAAYLLETLEESELTAH